MNTPNPKPPPVLELRILVVGIGVSALLILLGLHLYDLAGKEGNDFFGKLAELSLQLAVIVVAGVLVKVLVDWVFSRRARFVEQLDRRKEFMKRVRDMNVTVQHARDLLNAHQSARTWGEESRRLMRLRPEVADIYQDLKASTALFVRQAEIMKGLEAIILYLDLSRGEYVDNHGHVEEGHKAKQRLLDTIERHEMNWVREFMNGGDDYKVHYEANLEKAKGGMRVEVYGA